MHAIIKKEKGSALITALFIMAILAIAATAIAVSNQIAIRRTQLIQTHNQAMYFAQAISYWGAGVLIKNAREAHEKASQQQSGASKRAYVLPQNIRLDKLPQKFALTDLSSAKISGELSDAQACFNLNNLQQTKNRKPFMRLLRQAIPGLKSKNVNLITDQIVKRVSLTKEAMGQRYGVPIVDKSELRLLPGITAKIYTQLAPFVCALPVPMPLNINSAPVPLLMTLSDKMTKQLAAQLRKAIEETGGFNTLKDVQKNEVIKRLNIPASNYTLNSHYFYVQGRVALQGQQVFVRQLLQRMTLNNQVQIDVVWERHQ